MKELKTAMVDIELEWHFPFAFSAADGSHLLQNGGKSGSEAMKQYYNFKNFYFTILLALVDAKYRFTWLSVTTPDGNTHDSTYFQSRDLWNESCFRWRIKPSHVKFFSNDWLSNF